MVLWVLADPSKQAPSRQCTLCACLLDAVVCNSCKNAARTGQCVAHSFTATGTLAGWCAWWWAAGDWPDLLDVSGYHGLPDGAGWWAHWRICVRSQPVDAFAGCLMDLSGLLRSMLCKLSSTRALVALQGALCQEQHRGRTGAIEVWGVQGAESGCCRTCRRTPALGVPSPAMRG